MIVSYTLLVISLLILFRHYEVKGAKREGKELLNGVQLRNAAYNFPPMMSITKQPDGNFTYGGVYMDSLRLLARVFNLTYKQIHIDETAPDAKGLGIPDLLKRQLVRGEVDMANYHFELSLENMRYMELTFPQDTVVFTLLQPWPKEESRLTAPIRPFNWIVWLCFLGSAVIFILFMAQASIMEKDKTGRSIMFRDTLRSGSLWGLIYTQFEYVLTIVTSQGNYIRYTTGDLVRIAILFWLVPMFVLVYAYTGTLTAFLTAPKLEPIVSTLEELAETQKFHLTVEKNTLMASIIFNGDKEYYEVFRQDFHKDPSLLNENPLHMVNKVINDNCVYVENAFLANVFMWGDLKNNGRCRMTVPPNPLGYYIMYQSGFPRGSRYVRIIEQHYLMPTREYGFQKYFVSQHYPSSTQCLVDGAGSQNGIKVISLADLSAPFFILIVGLTMASISFILENIFYYIIAKKKKIATV